MNERKIIDGRLLADLAKEVGLNASHLEVLGERQHWEIFVGGDTLERLVDIQRWFEQLAVMGDDEYRGFLYRGTTAYAGRVGRCRGVDCFGGI